MPGRTFSWPDLFKINLLSLKDGLDLSTPAGRLMANVLASVAAYETEVRSERVRAGQDVAWAAGKHLGRPAGIRKPVKVTREQDTLVRRMRTEGEPIASIVLATGLKERFRQGSLLSGPPTSRRSIRSSASARPAQGAKCSS